MLAAPPKSEPNPCDGLHTLPLYLDGERESLPADCGPTPVLVAPESPAHLATVTLADYRHSLRDPDFVPQALRMALIIGSLVFAMNHGKALLQREMDRDRWLLGA